MDIVEDAVLKGGVRSMNSTELKKILHSRLWGKRSCDLCEKIIESTDHYFAVIENNLISTGTKRISKNFCELCGKEKRLNRE